MSERADHLADAFPKGLGKVNQSLGVECVRLDPVLQTPHLCFEGLNRLPALLYTGMQSFDHLH